MGKQLHESERDQSPPPAAEAQADNLLEQILAQTEADKEKLKDVRGIKTETRITEEQHILASAAAAIRAAKLKDVQVKELDRGRLKQLIQQRREQLQERLSRGLDNILHDAKFRKIEAAWEALRLILQRVEVGDKLKVQLLNAGRKDLTKDMEKAGEASDSYRKSALFRNLYRGALGQAGGAPFTAVISGIQIRNPDSDKDPNEDLKLLSKLGKVCQEAHAPWISPAAPDFFDCDSFLEFDAGKDWKKAFTVNRPKWKSFREKEESRYVGLALPATILRAPYKEYEISDFFKYSEGVKGSKDYLWGGAAHLFGAVIGKAYVEYGWPARICGKYHGGRVDDLVVGNDMKRPGKKIPIELRIDDILEGILAELGFVPFVHELNSSGGYYYFPSTTHAPKKSGNIAADDSDKMSSRFPHLLVACRFAHYLKIILRNKIGGPTSQDGLKKELEKWLTKYTLGETTNEPTARDLAECPLKSFNVKVTEKEAGVFETTIEIFPHNLLEAVAVKIQIFASKSQGKAE